MEKYSGVRITNKTNKKNLNSLHRGLNLVQSVYSPGLNNTLLSRLHPWNVSQYRKSGLNIYIPRIGENVRSQLPRPSSWVNCLLSPLDNLLQNGGKWDRVRYLLFLLISRCVEISDFFFSSVRRDANGFVAVRGISQIIYFATMTKAEKVAEILTLISQFSDDDGGIGFLMDKVCCVKNISWEPDPPFNNCKYPH